MPLVLGKYGGTSELSWAHNCLMSQAWNYTLATEAIAFVAPATGLGAPSEVAHNNPLRFSN